MAIDRKYGRIELERGDIGEDEPVFVFRAQDVMLPAILGIYMELCLLNGSSAWHLEGIAEARHQVEQWQRDNHTQVPRSDPQRTTEEESL